MRNWFWSTLIVLALVAIVAGYVSGSGTAHPPPTVARGASHVAPARRPRIREVAVRDLFSRDAVEIGHPLMARVGRRPQRLSIVVGLCGQSVAVESGFLGLGVPLTFDLDPHAAQAAAFAADVRAAGDRLYVHLERPPSASELASLRAQLGQFDGVASRRSAGMAAALTGQTLAFFDERGEADARPFRRDGVPFVQRDMTVDDRAQRSYIAYMLRRAAERSEYEGASVTLMRPTPTSLAALVGFLRDSHTDIVAAR